MKKWRMHNKNFSSEFYCKHCGRKFIGRVSFKKRYDGVKVNKRTLDIVPEKKKEEQPAEKTTA